MRLEERVAVQALALLELLLSDRRSPLYVAAEPLGEALDRVSEALRRARPFACAGPSDAPYGASS